MPHDLPSNDESYILRHNDERGMSRDEIMKTSGTLIVAGSETTATLLSGALFHLLKSPQNLEILVDEICTTFDSPADMNFAKLGNLRHLKACLQETFRMYPPVPGVLPRRVPKGGSTINGYFLPEKVSMHKFTT
jgi:cytochrome P450